MSVKQIFLAATVASVTLFACKGKDESTSKEYIIVRDTVPAVNMGADTAKVNASATPNATAAPIAAPAPAPRRTTTTTRTTRNSGTSSGTSTSTASTGNAGTSGTSGTTAPAPTTEKKGISKAAKGAIIGGVGGAVAGAVISKDAKGAAIGGAVGAAGGYIIGRQQDKKDGRVQ